jgi:hypothetical protein
MATVTVCATRQSSKPLRVTVTMDAPAWIAGSATQVTFPSHSALTGHTLLERSQQHPAEQAMQLVTVGMLAATG